MAVVKKSGYYKHRVYRFTVRVLLLLDDSSVLLFTSIIIIPGKNILIEFYKIRWREIKFFTKSSIESLSCYLIGFNKYF